MISVGVRELKNNLSHYLRGVNQGRAVSVTERGESIALLVNRNRWEASKDA